MCTQAAYLRHDVEVAVGSQVAVALLAKGRHKGDGSRDDRANDKRLRCGAVKHVGVHRQPGVAGEGRWHCIAWLVAGVRWRHRHHCLRFEPARKAGRLAQKTEQDGCRAKSSSCSRAGQLSVGHATQIKGGGAASCSS